jgi:AcrR family transcriptional regulator
MKPAAATSASGQGSDSFSNLPLRALVHVPQQERSARRVHDILDRAMEVLLAEGAEGFNTNRVADHAGVSVGSIYQYFPNKQQILAGIIERGLLDSEQLLRAVVEPGAARPVTELVAEGLDGLVGLLLPYRALLKELFAEATPFGTDSVLTPIEETLGAIAADWLAARGESVLLAHGAATLQLALRGGIYMFLRWLVEQPCDAPRQEFVSALAQHVTAGIEEVGSGRGKA